MSLKTIYAGLALSTTLGVSYGIVDSGLLDTVERAQETTMRVNELNKAATLEAAHIRFELDHGRRASAQELVSAGYVKAQVLEED